MNANQTTSDIVIVHVDPDFVIVDKPSGLLSVPGRGPEKADCVWRRVQAQFPEALTVHRLDMETSGLMVFARSIDAQRHLGKAFENRQVEKKYEAIVAPMITGDEGEISFPLICDWPNRPRQIVDHEIGKPSLTRYRVLARDAASGYAGCTRVRLFPLTGRSHQLRVHMQAIGHPILGDSLYANESTPPSSRLLLHAAKLAFPMPNGANATFQSAVPF
ncbi:MAG: RluA family pseudouridine synthase [Betaproteobacteria bacterium]|nr:MAG: RluA family pseudouridine synthase [Betaproteobacteria bacterium]